MPTTSGKQTLKNKGDTMQGFLVVTFRDSFNQETTRRYELRDGAGLDAGARLQSIYARAQALYADLTNVTGAAIVKVGVDITEPEFGLSEAVDTLTNISDDGVLSVAIWGLLAKKGTIRVPSPVSTAIKPNGAPDETNAVWTNFVDNFVGLASNAYVSDGERVDDAQGTDGILKTWRASRGRRSE